MRSKNVANKALGRIKTESSKVVHIETAPFDATEFVLFEKKFVRD